MELVFDTLNDISRALTNPPEPSQISSEPQRNDEEPPAEDEDEDSTAEEPVEERQSPRAEAEPAQEITPEVLHEEISLLPLSRRWVPAALVATAALVVVGSLILLTRGDAPEAEITLSVDSQPQGAEVWDLSSEERLGVTPLETTVASDGERHLLELRKAGFSSAQRSIELRRDTHIAVIMSPVQSEAPPEQASTSGDASLDALPLDRIESDASQAVVEAADVVTTEEDRRESSREETRSSRGEGVERERRLNDRRGLLDPFAD
jgi:hypothetical protein